MRRVHHAKLRRAALAVTLLAAIPVKAEERIWDFRVMLNQDMIGHHRYTLRERGAERELVNEARFSVKVLGFTVYRYAHDATERWRAGCLASLTARTDDNGDKLRVATAREGDRLTVAGGRIPASIEGCVMTFAYWNPDILRQMRLLNAQTGEHEAVRVTRVGEETITVRGAAVSATRYRISGSKHPIDLWYSPREEWLALESTLEGGRRLRYQLN